MGSNCCKCANDKKNKHLTSTSSNSSGPWTRGDVELVGERFSSVTQRGTVTLNVRNATVDDSGRYSLSARNDAGHAHSDLLLEVRTRPGDVPVFLRRLNDLAVKVGTRTRFLVEIRSPTQVKVSWEQEGKPVVEGERFHLLHEGNFFCVDVAPVTLGDAGLWICRAHNSNGTATCFCHLNVLVPKAYKAPHFIEELVAILTEQGTVSLECKVVGVPTPTLRWFKDNKEIKAGDVFALSANPQDTTSLGTYTCEATNCMGRAYSTSRVHVLNNEGSVQPVDSLVPKGPAPVFSKELRNEKVKIGGKLTLSCKVSVPPWPKTITWFNKAGLVESGGRYHIIEDGLGAYSVEVDPVEANDEGEWKCVATSNHGVKGISTCNVSVSYPKNYKKPKFLESLKAILTEEGLVSFECKVVGYPTPQLRWFKDGQELKPGDVYQLTGTNSLGSYCCIAKNCMGETSSTAELTVEDIQSQLNEEEKLQLYSKNQPPRFLQGLKSLEAKIMDPLRFTVQVSVSPQPSVAWYRDDEEVQESDRYKKEQETKGFCHLIIKRLELMDQAEWKCVATNDYGQSVTSCFLKLSVPRHYKKPRFLENLRAVLSEEGAVNLECKVIGVPQPTLKWYKDGRELKPGDIHRIISGQDGTCCLGTYTCEATNCMGTVASSASLLGFEDRAQVKPQPEPLRPLPPPAAHLVRHPSLSTILEERTSQLHDTVTSDERAEVSFSFDGKEVSVSLYETPDLTEEEALQVVEMYAEELSEHISGLQEVKSLEHNVVELPPMRFVKETSQSGHLLMEAVVIDVSPEYYASAEDRTEADLDEFSITEDNGFMSPQVLTPEEMPFDNFTAEFLERTAQLGPKSVPVKPPRKRGADNSESSYHSLKEAKLSPEEESSEFADALSSIKDKSQKDSFGSAKSAAEGSRKTPADNMEIGLEHRKPEDLNQQGNDKLTESKKPRKKSRSRSRSAEIQPDENFSKTALEKKVPKRPLKKRKSTDSEKEDDSLQEFERQKSLKAERGREEDLEKLHQKYRIKKSKSSESEKEDDSLQEFESRKSLQRTDKDSEIKTIRKPKSYQKKQLSDSSGREDDSLIEYEKKKAPSDGISEKNSSKSEKQDRQKAPLSKSISTDSSEKEETFAMKSEQSDHSRKRKKRSIKKSGSTEKKTDTPETGVEIPPSSEAESCDRDSLKNKKVISTSDLDRMRSTSDLESIGDKSRAQEEEERSVDFDTAEDSAYDKSEMSVLESLTHSIKKIKNGLADVEERVISESTDEPQSAKSSLSAIESLVQPINEIQRGLIEVEKQAEETEAGQYSPSSILETLKEPIQEFGRNLAEIEKAKTTESGDESLLKRTSQTLLETVSHPLQELQKELNFIQQQAMIETGEETYSDVLQSFKPSLLVVQGGVEQTEGDFTSKIEDLTDVTVLPQGTYAHQTEQTPRNIEELKNQEVLGVKENDLFVPLTVQDIEESLAETAVSLTTLGAFDLSSELEVFTEKLENCLRNLNKNAEDTADGEVKDILISLGKLVTPLEQFKNVIEKCLRLVDENDKSNDPQVRSSNMVLKATLESPVHALGKCLNLLETAANSKSGKEIRGLGIKILYKLSFPLEELNTTMKLIENLSEHTSIELLVTPVENLISAASVINLEASKSGFAENIPEEGGFIVRELDDAVGLLSKSVAAMTKDLSSQSSLKTLSSLIKPLGDFQKNLHKIENKIKTPEKYRTVTTSEIYSLAQDLSKPLQAIRTELSIAQHEIELDQYSHFSLLSDSTQDNTLEFATNIIHQSLEQVHKSVLTCTEFVLSKSPSETLYFRYLLFALNELILPFNQLNKSVIKAKGSISKEVEKISEPNFGISAVTSSASELLRVLSELHYHSLTNIGHPESQMIQLICTMEEPLSQVERGLCKIIEHNHEEDKNVLNINMLKTLAEPFKGLQKSLINIYEKLGLEPVSQETFLELRHPIQELQRSILIIQDQVSFEYGDEPASIESNIVTLQSLVNPLNALKKRFMELDDLIIDKTQPTSYSKENKNLHSIMKVSHELQLKLSSIMVEENYVNKHSLDSLDMFPIFQDLTSLLRDFENAIKRVDLICQNETKPDVIVYNKLCEAVKFFTNEAANVHNKIMLASNKAIKDMKHPIHFLKRGTETFITKIDEMATELENCQLDEASIISGSFKFYHGLLQNFKEFSEFIKEMENGSEEHAKDSTDVSLLSSSDTIKDVNTIMEEVTQTRVSLESVNISSSKNNSLVKARKEVKTFCELLKSAEDSVIENTITKANSMNFDQESERRPLIDAFSSMVEQLHKIETYVVGNQEAIESINCVRNIIGVIQEHLNFGEEISEVYILQNLSTPLKYFKDKVIKALETISVRSEESPPVSVYLERFEKSASDLELGLMKLEHALLNSTGDFSSLKNIDINVIAQPIEELVGYINSIEEQQTGIDLSETLVDQSSLSMLKTLAQPIREIREGVLLIQEQIALEASGKTPSGKSCASILYEIAKPIRELRSGVALIQEQIVMEPDVEPLSEETRASSLQTFAVPIEEIKKVLSNIIEQQPLIFEADVQSMSENISLLKTIAEPVKELQNKLASIEINQIMESGVEPFSVKENILALAKPVQSLQEGIALVESQMVLESGIEPFSVKENILALAKPVQALQEGIALVESQMVLESAGDDLSLQNNVSILKEIAKPLLEISKGIAVIFEQQFIEEGNVEDVPSISEFSTLANVTDISLADAAVHVGETVTLEHGVSFQDDKLAPQLAKTTIEENLQIGIIEQQQVLMGADIQIENKRKDIVKSEKLDPANSTLVAQEVILPLQVQEHEILSQENTLTLSEDRTVHAAKLTESLNIGVQAEFQQAVVHVDNFSVEKHVEETAILQDLSLNIAAQVDAQEVLSNAKALTSKEDLSLTEVEPDTLTPCIVQGELQQSLADVESLETEEGTLESISIQETSFKFEPIINDIQQALSDVEDFAVSEKTLCEAEIKTDIREAVQNEMLQPLDKEGNLKSLDRSSEEANISVITPNIAAETELCQIISNVDDIETVKHLSDLANFGEVPLQSALQVECQQILSDVESLKTESVSEKISQAMALEVSHLDIAIKTQVQEFFSVAEQIEAVKNELEVKVTHEPLVNEIAKQEVQQVLQIAEDIITLKKEIQANIIETPIVTVEFPDIKQVLSTCENVKHLKAKVQEIPQDHPEIEKDIESILSLAESLGKPKDIAVMSEPKESGEKMNLEKSLTEVKSSLPATPRTISEGETIADLRIHPESQAQIEMLSSSDTTLQDEVLPATEPSSKLAIETQLQKFIIAVEDVSYSVNTLQAKLINEPAIKYAVQQEFQEILSTINYIKTMKDNFQVPAKQEDSFKLASQVEIQQVLLACNSFEKLKETLEAKLSKELKVHSAIESELQQILSSANTFQIIKQSLTANIIELKPLDSAISVVPTLLSSNETEAEKESRRNVEVQKAEINQETVKVTEMLETTQLVGGDEIKTDNLLELKNEVGRDSKVNDGCRKVCDVNKVEIQLVEEKEEKENAGNSVASMVKDNTNAVELIKGKGDRNAIEEVQTKSQPEVNTTESSEVKFDDETVKLREKDERTKTNTRDVDTKGAEVIVDQTVSSTKDHHLVEVHSEKTNDVGTKPKTVKDGTKKVDVGDETEVMKVITIAKVEDRKISKEEETKTKAQPMTKSKQMSQVAELKQEVTDNDSLKEPKCLERDNIITEIELSEGKNVQDFLQCTNLIAKMETISKPEVNTKEPSKVKRDSEAKETIKFTEKDEKTKTDTRHVDSKDAEVIVDKTVNAAKDHKSQSEKENDIGTNHKTVKVDSKEVIVRDETEMMKTLNIGQVKVSKNDEEKEIQIKSQLMTKSKQISEIDELKQEVTSKDNIKENIEPNENNDTKNEKPDVKTSKIVEGKKSNNTRAAKIETEKEMHHLEKNVNQGDSTTVEQVFKDTSSKKELVDKSKNEEKEIKLESKTSISTEKADVKKDSEIQAETNRAVETVDKKVKSSKDFSEKLETQSDVQRSTTDIDIKTTERKGKIGKVTQGEENASMETKSLIKPTLDSSCVSKEDEEIKTESHVSKKDVMETDDSREPKVIKQKKEQGAIKDDKKEKLSVDQLEDLGTVKKNLKDEKDEKVRDVKREETAQVQKHEIKDIQELEHLEKDSEKKGNKLNQGKEIVGEEVSVIGTVEEVPKISKGNEVIQKKNDVDECPKIGTGEKNDKESTNRKSEIKVTNKEDKEVELNKQVEILTDTKSAKEEQTVMVKEVKEGNVKDKKEKKYGTKQNSEMSEERGGKIKEEIPPDILKKSEESTVISEINVEKSVHSTTESKIIKEMDEQSVLSTTETKDIKEKDDDVKNLKDDKVNNKLGEVKSDSNVVNKKDKITMKEKDERGKNITNFEEEEKTGKTYKPTKDTKTKMKEDVEGIKSKKDYGIREGLKITESENLPITTEVSKSVEKEGDRQSKSDKGEDKVKKVKQEAIPAAAVTKTSGQTTIKDVSGIEKVKEDKEGTEVTNTELKLEKMMELKKEEEQVNLKHCEENEDIKATCTLTVDTEIKIKKDLTSTQLKTEEESKERSEITIGEMLTSTTEASKLDEGDRQAKNRKSEGKVKKLKPENKPETIMTKEPSQITDKDHNEIEKEKEGDKKETAVTKPESKMSKKAKSKKEEQENQDEVSPGSDRKQIKDGEDDNKKEQNESESKVTKIPEVKKVKKEDKGKVKESEEIVEGKNKSNEKESELSKTETDKKCGTAENKISQMSKDKQIEVSETKIMEDISSVNEIKSKKDEVVQEIGNALEVKEEGIEVMKTQEKPMVRMGETNASRKSAQGFEIETDLALKNNYDNQDKSFVTTAVSASQESVNKKKSPNKQKEKSIIDEKTKAIQQKPRTTDAEVEEKLFSVEKDKNKQRLDLDESSTSDYGSESYSEPYQIKKSQSYDTTQWVYDSKSRAEEETHRVSSKHIREQKHEVSGLAVHETITYTPRQSASKPLFCGRLVDRTAAQGSKLKVTCSLTGTPDPTVQWFKDGHPIDTSLDHRIRTRLSNGLASLEILEAKVGDSGKYTCVARNTHGEASTTANIKVFSYLESAPEAPVFTQHIRDHYKSASDELVIECRVKGHPQPSVVWTKDGQPLRPLARYEQSVLTDGTCRLVIHGPEACDSGLYKCVAENAVWSENTSSHITFEGREKYVAESRSLTDPKLPRFTNIVSDTTVREGGTVALQVAVKGTPRAEVTWYRGSEPLPKRSSRFRYLEDAGVYSLVMTDASVKEAGTYTCRASNAYGFRDTSVNVEIVQASGASGPARGKPAMFISRPDTSLSIAMGEDVSFSFRVSGDPKPRVTWMKGMKDITNNIRTLKETINDYVRLTLKHATIIDAGTYFIMAKNIYGADYAFVTVRVKQRARSLTPTRTTIWSGPDTSTILRDIHESTRALVNDVPGPISSAPVVSDCGKNWLSLSWGKPEHRGAAPVLAYRVEAWLLGTEGGAQWTELGVTPINSFDVFFLKPGSEYKFRVTARNRYGWGESVTTTEPISVGSVANFPPDIVRDLPGPLKALQGHNVTLECEINGDPPPTIQWLKDGQNVGTLATLKGRVFVSDDKLIHHLIIKQLTEDDSGRYVCEAVNKVGRASTYARLLVVTDPRLLDADRKLKESLLEQQESAPQFTMRLRDRRVQASYPVRLSCQVIGSPTPSVTWTCQGQPITADDRYQIVQEADHFHTLEICRTLLEDSGEYTATAQNCLGAVSCHCQLIVDKGIRAYISPEFICELSPAVTVKDGAELRLFAQVEAYPTVSISWQRDGVRLRPSRRLVMTLDPEGRVELALAHLTVRDAGLYTCSATNAVGWAETVCQVFVTGGTPVAAGVPTITTSSVPYSKEPRFVTKPRSSEAVEGDTVVITCEVVGDPQPEVMWLRDWLKPGYYRDAPQFRQVAGGSQYSLEIPQVKLDFTGTYCVIARNTHGEAKAIISLQIYAKGQGKESSMVSGHVKHGQVETLPEIKRELKDLRCCDGDAVTLECLVSAIPLPSVRWEKDGKILPLGEDIEAELDGEIARLTIKKVYPEDEGQYSCVAYNDLGRAVTSACLVVDVPEEKETLLSQQLTRPPGLLSARSTPRSTPRNTPSPARSLSPTPARYREFSSPSFSRPKRVKMSSPKFYTVPHNRIAEEGETVRFQCSVAGHPTPWASWDKDGHIVTPSSRLSVTERDDLRTLELREVTVEDAGLYRVTLENEMGSVEATARLDIIGRQGSRTRSVRAWSGVRSSPTFGRRLVGSAARVGGTFTLTCDVHASPSPVTSWYRNGEMLVKSPHVVPSWDGRRARLELRGLQPEDAGVYTCVAENTVGTTQCSAELRVLQTTDPSDADLQPPVFMQGLPPEQTAAEGQPFELQVRLQGSSPLEVVWVKDGVEVPDCPDLRHVDYGDGRFGLRIADVFVADGGIYNCEAFNDHGDAITSGHLIVNDLSGGEGSSTEPEIAFTKTPSPVLARLRGQVSFCARLQSRPLSHTSFTWTVNGRSVNSNDRFTVTNEDDCSILHVAEVCPCDIGTVVCTARVCSPGVPPTTVSCDTTLGLDPTPGAPAELLRGPCDTTAMRGDRVLLKATYRGDPEPSVRWLKAGRELSSEGRVQITSRDGVSCLTISAIDADDSGKYVVSVENIHGADCHFASVAVEGPPEAPAARPSVSSAGEGSVTVAWSSPPYDGGCVITGYRVEMRTALSHQWSVVADRCHSLSHVVGGLTPGQTYLFRVRAENIHGASESSAESFPFLLQSPHAGLREEEGDGDGEVESDAALEPRLVTLEPGDQFLECYSVHEELGKGRYGVVHKVTDLRTGHTMAAKFVRCIKKQDREKVQEEIDIMNCLRHPKLLQLAAAFENPKDMVMVMEYISGGELFERVVADDFTLTERDCILFLRQICEGVRYMHTCNVVHLDLKPENIMCHTRTSHRVKIIDFGLAQKLESNTPVRVLFGTPEFIPPEIINYEPIGVESDMWSVGVICYVLLSGLSPFMGDNDAETFANITRADFDFDDEAFEAISQDAKDFISSLLVKRKEKRLTAEECLKHKWLTQSDTTMSSVKLCTDKLKKFIIRRKWQPLPRNERQIA